MPSDSESQGYSEEFIEEDDGGDTEEEELLEAKITEEHEKFKQAQEERQAKVRETRAWSAPHLESPRPEEQRERRVESAKLSSEEAEATAAAPRSEYEPVSRPSASGKPSTLQDILEDEEAPTSSAKQSAASEGSVADEKASASASPEASTDSVKAPAPVDLAAAAADGASTGGNTSLDSAGAAQGTAAGFAPPAPPSVVAASVTSVRNVGPSSTVQPPGPGSLLHAPVKDPSVQGSVLGGGSLLHPPFKDSSVRGSVLGGGFGGGTASDAGRWVVGEPSAGSVLKEDDDDDDDEEELGVKAQKPGAKGIKEEEEEEEEEEEAAEKAPPLLPPLLSPKRDEVKEQLDEIEAASSAVKAPAPQLQPPLPSDSPSVSAVCVPTTLPAAAALRLEDSDSVFIEEDNEDTDVDEDVVPLSAINLGSELRVAKPAVAAVSAEAGSEDGAEAAAAEEEEEKVEMMAPHDFALRLLTHDLRTLPAHQAAAAAAGASPGAAKRPQSGKSRYHGKAVAAATGPGPAQSPVRVDRTRPFSAPNTTPQATAPGTSSGTVPAQLSKPGVQRQASISSSTGWSGVKTTSATVNMSHTLRHEAERRDELFEAAAAAADEQQAQALEEEASGGGWDSGSEKAASTHGAGSSKPAADHSRQLGDSEPEDSSELGATPAARGVEREESSGMMAPHEFALRLLTHDLRTLPTHRQAAAAAGRPPSASGQRTDGGKSRYLATAAEQPSRTASQQQRAARPSSAPMAHAGAARTEIAAAAPGRGGRQIYSAVAKPRRAPSESSSRGWSEAKVDADLTLGMSRAMRSSAGEKDGGWVAPGGRPGAAMARSASSSSHMTSLSDQAGPAADRRSWEGSASWYGAAPEAAYAAAPPPRGLGTAPVSVGGVNVSVYVADTMKQIQAANRWMAALGSNRRYQLRDPNDNSYVLLLGGEAWTGGDGEGDSVNVLKTMALSQFLAALKQLKARVKQQQATGKQVAGPRPDDGWVPPLNGTLDAVPQPAGGGGGSERGDAGGGGNGLLFRYNETADWFRGAAGSSNGGAGALGDHAGAAEGTEELEISVAEAVHSEVKAATKRCKQLATQVSMLRLRPPRNKA